MKLDRIKKAVEMNDKIGMEMDPNDVIQDECWEAFIEELTRNIDETVKYFNEECTDNELFWISPVFEEIIDATQSKEILNAIRHRYERITEDSLNQAKEESEFIKENCQLQDFKKNIGEEIEYASHYLRS